MKPRATRAHLLRVMARERACNASWWWVEMHPYATPRQLWVLCRHSSWLAWLIGVLSKQGGCYLMWNSYWQERFGHSIHEASYTCYPEFKAHVTPAACRRAVPWHLVNDALVREGSK